MADYDKDAVPVGYVHATVTLAGEAKLLAAELERLRVSGLVDRANLEVVVHRSRLDPTPELKRLPPIVRGESQVTEADLPTIEKRLGEKELNFLAEMIRRFEAITTD
ncbi:hypothetical protein DLJ53_25095 [Acuticoccus sediminis]|uniref:Uncharacterized protein n=1 Tax=Acuticoccus sediminis TaxID=2184697 RepID=A0A8B2NP98_9HYPH|nr:hypothetical protein [Acuticoccus sediminis]RAH98909.1 hypothetical protein DLJ53_25095 [Acuticoccus sediminis]